MESDNIGINTSSSDNTMSRDRPLLTNSYKCLNQTPLHMQLASLIVVLHPETRELCTVSTLTFSLSHSTYNGFYMTSIVQIQCMILSRLVLPYNNGQSTIWQHLLYNTHQTKTEP